MDTTEARPDASPMEMVHLESSTRNDDQSLNEAPAPTIRTVSTMDSTTTQALPDGTPVGMFQHDSSTGNDDQSLNEDPAPTIRTVSTMDSTTTQALPDGTPVEMFHPESSTGNDDQSLNEAPAPTMASSFGEYNMAHGDRGHALIFNNREFQHEKLKERRGTDMDLKRMLSVLKDEFGFKKSQVKHHHNVQVKDMLKFIVEAAAKDYSNSDCFVCVILSYGTRGGEIYGADGDEPISLSDLIKPLMEPLKGKSFQACQTLRGKPKIFFIQACPHEEGTRKGENEDDAASDNEDVAAELEGTVQISSEADFFIACSTMPESLTRKGSYFIQTLNEVIKANRNTDDLLSMLTKVISKVAEKVGDKDDVEVPYVKSMLTKKVFFRNALE